MKKQLTTLVVRNLLEDCGDNWNARSYSGRGMYGDQCLGVVVRQGEELVVGASLAAAAVNDLAVDTEDATDILDEVEQLMRSARIDSMGLDVIVYWPSLTIGEGFDDDEDGPDEDEDFEEASGR